MSKSRSNQRIKEKIVTPKSSMKKKNVKSEFIFEDDKALQETFDELKIKTSMLKDIQHALSFLTFESYQHKDIIS
jgi:hypothetical protein